VYGQIEAAVAGEPLGLRAQRLADDLKRWPGSNLPNELTGIYNRLLDDALATGSDDPFLIEEMRAHPRDSGFSSLPSAYAGGTLEACAAALGASTEAADSESVDAP
jgi:hypothetical protein